MNYRYQISPVIQNLLFFHSQVVLIDWLTLARPMLNYGCLTIFNSFSNLLICFSSPYAEYNIYFEVLQLCFSCKYGLRNTGAFKGIIYLATKLYRFVALIMVSTLCNEQIIINNLINQSMLLGNPP